MWASTPDQKPICIRTHTHKRLKHLIKIPTCLPATRTGTALCHNRMRSIHPLARKLLPCKEAESRLTHCNHDLRTTEAIVWMAWAIKLCLHVITHFLEQTDKFCLLCLVSAGLVFMAAYECICDQPEEQFGSYVRGASSWAQNSRLTRSICLVNWRTIPIHLPGELENCS